MLGGTSLMGSRIRSHPLASAFAPWTRRSRACSGTLQRSRKKVIACLAILMSAEEVPGPLSMETTDTAVTFYERPATDALGEGVLGHPQRWRASRVWRAPNSTNVPPPATLDHLRTVLLDVRQGTWVGGEAWVVPGCVCLWWRRACAVEARATEREDRLPICTAATAAAVQLLLHYIYLPGLYPLIPTFFFLVSQVNHFDHRSLQASSPRQHPTRLPRLLHQSRS